MIDLETLGNKPGSVIVSLGAVKFGDNAIEDTFYCRVDAASCVALGLKMDAQTVLWWMKQDDAARLEIAKPGEALVEVLERFSQWLGDPEAEVWGNGASFDNVLLTCAYEAAKLRVPWKYTNDRCYRTLRNLRPEVKMQRSGELHNALEDARSQALHLIEILRTLS